MGSSWVDLKPQKSVILKYHFLSFYTTTTNHFSIGLWRVMKSDFYMTAGNDQLSGWTEKRLQSNSQSQTCTKNRSWSLFGGLLPVWSPQLSESCWNHYIWEVCSGNWWDSLKTAMPLASIGQQKGPKSSPWKCPITHRTTNASIAERIGLPSFTSSSIFTWPLAHRLPLLQASWQLFAGKLLPQLAGWEKCFPRVGKIPEFYATGISKHIFHWPKCVDYNGS